MNFQIVTSVPISLNPGAIERAVSHFIDDIENKNIPIDNDGRFNQLIHCIHSCLVTKTNPDYQIWIAEDTDKEIASLAITNFQIDVDNKLTLMMSMAWVRPRHRFTKLPKQWFHQMEDFGKAAGAKHLLIPSARGSKGYLRFVGKDWHQYEVILKRDL